MHELQSCFDQKSDLYGTLNELISQSKSLQSDLDSAYQKLKKNKASKDDFYNWSNRQKSMWNGYSGRGGKKIRSHINPKSIFDKYSREDLDRFKANIETARSTIGALKSKRESISSEIDQTKSELGKIKALCAYVKTQEGKNERNALKINILSMNEEISKLKSSLKSQSSLVEDQLMSIKASKTEWRHEKRKIKLSQP